MMSTWGPELESFLLDCTSLKNARTVLQNQVLGMIQSVRRSGKKLRSRTGLFTLRSITVYL
jgi:hypothetical protein